MKKFLLLFIPFTAYSQNKTSQFIIEFNLIAPIKNQMVYLEYPIFSKGKLITHIDSTFLKDNKCMFTGQINEPTKASIFCYAFGSAGPKSSQVFFLAPGKTKIESTSFLQNSTISGTPEAEAFMELLLHGKKFDIKKRFFIDSVEFYESIKDKGGLERMKLKYKLLQKEIQDSVYIPFYMRHLNSTVGIYALQQIANNDLLESSRLVKLYAQLSAKLKKSQAALELEKTVEVSKKTAIGSLAINFTMPNEEGKMISLSSFKGKYVLIDFWASWCMPCRAEIPNLVAAYAKYRINDFTILSVALERPGDREKWIKIIVQEDLSWSHVSDFKFWETKPVKELGINAIPFNLLLNPEGKIIARNIHGTELSETLSKLFN